jgi:hypothetical protein
MRLRSALVPLALGALVLTGTSSTAAVGNDIVDTAGDAMTAQAGQDILGVDFHMTTTDVVTTTVVKGKKKKVVTKTPKDLVVTMTLAGPPAIDPGISYQIGAETDCGHLFVYSYFSALDAGPADSFQFSGCGGEDATQPDGEANFTVDAPAVIKGNTITYTVSAKALPKEIGMKSVFTELLAYTAVTEPAVGYATADFVPESAIDYATGDAAVLG